jgi:pimeloyl-ACP methyl ester carboxylesterase
VLASSESPVVSEPFERDGQKAFFHDEGDAYGFFHTYDAFSACATTRKVHVFLPRDYERSGQRHPVVYMNDGDTAFWPGAVGKTWGVQRTLSALGNSIERPIVVALVPRDRDYEYTYNFWAPTRSYGGLVDYARDVATCVKPWIDAKYRTQPGAANTSIVGSSNGGLASYWMATRYPRVFGTAASMSPSFWAGLRGQSVAQSELVLPVAGLLASQPRPSFYLDWGLRRTNVPSDTIIEAQATNVAKQMVRVLRDRGYSDRELRVVEDPIGGHDEDAWAYRFGLFAQWRFAK